MVKGIQTVEEMLEVLSQYSSNLMISMFDCDNCPVTVMSEKKEKNEKVYRWITLSTQARTKARTVEELSSLLRKVPPFLTITLRGMDNKFSEIFIGEEGIKGSPNHWLVFCDRLAYEKYYAQEESVNDLKQQALDKMLKEMLEEHTPTEDVIHNWLCVQEDMELWQGILKEDRSIKQAVNYCLSKAREENKQAQSAMVDDTTVFGWVHDYYLLDKIEVPKVAGTVKTKPKARAKVKAETEGEQIDLFA